MAQVLLVEPDRPLRKFVAGILGDFGHDVAQCESLAQAWKALRERRFDVLATDLALHRELGKYHAQAPHLRIIGLTGRPICSDTAPLCERPPSLQDKPFRFGDLSTLVRMVSESDNLQMRQKRFQRPRRRCHD